MPTLFLFLQQGGKKKQNLGDGKHGHSAVLQKNFRKNFSDLKLNRRSIGSGMHVKEKNLEMANCKSDHAAKVSTCKMEPFIIK